MPKINKEEYETLKGLDDKWKWIARDEDTSLWVFTEKPFKKSGRVSSSCWDTETGRSYPVLELIDEIHLFQFIQWEDEEPYSIQGLINEYLDDEYGYFNMKLSREFEEFIKKESEEAEMTKSIEWLKNEVNELPLRLLGFSMSKQREEFTVDKTDVLELINQLDEPEVLSQEWIDNHTDKFVSNGDLRFVSTKDLQNLLVPTLSEMETVEITEEQVVEWLNNNDFYDHRTAETVLANAVDKGELGYYGTKYSVVKKEPETVEEVVADFARSLERLRELWRNIGVEELEE